MPIMPTWRRPVSFAVEGKIRREFPPAPSRRKAPFSITVSMAISSAAATATAITAATTATAVAIPLIVLVCGSVGGCL